MSNFPGLSIDQIAQLDPRQIKHVYLRPKDENSRPGASGGVTDPFEAYIRGLEWQGITREKAEQMLAEKMGGQTPPTGSQPPPS